ncbi:MAG: hypothetical protein M1269_00275 [Chloroflexi bacterium]|nr:hypothetical protein [Chloroflexota bacterium]
MPIYQYRCNKCGHDTEVLQAGTKPLKQTCEKCGSDMHRIISPVGIIFKGGGFHVNDYGRSGSKAGAVSGKKEKETAPSGTKKEEKSAAKSDTTSTAATESKSESKSD